jgi:hypothetical protein
MGKHYGRTWTTLASLLTIQLGGLVWGMAAGPAQASPAAGLGGSYDLVNISDQIGAAGFGRGSGRGHLQVDSSTGRIHFEYGETVMSLGGGCPVAASQQSACARRFDRSQTNRSVHNAGTYQLSADGTLSVALDAPDSTGLTTLGGFVNTDRGILVLASRSDQGTHVMVAVHHDFDGHRPDAFGKGPVLFGQYAYNARSVEFPRSITSVQGKWDSYGTDVRYGDLSAAGFRYILNQSDTAMQEALTCVSAAGGCAASASILSSLAAGVSAGETLSGRNGQVFLIPDGHQDASLAWQGAVSGDGTFAAVESANATGQQGVALLVRKGSGLSNTTAVGTFNAVAMEEFFDSDSGVRSAFVNGKIVFDNQSQWTFNGTDSSTKRFECAGNQQCPSPGLFSRTVAGGAGGSYTVGTRGDISMVGVAGDNTPRVFAGTVSPDGSIVVLRRVVDSGACSFDCTGTESARSLILAMRP